MLEVMKEHFKIPKSLILNILQSFSIFKKNCKQTDLKIAFFHLRLSPPQSNFYHLKKAYFCKSTLNLTKIDIFDS